MDGKIDNIPKCYIVSQSTQHPRLVEEPTIHQLDSICPEEVSFIYILYNGVLAVQGLYDVPFVEF